MTDERNAAMLGEIAAQAALERAAWINDAAEGLDRFLRANRDRIHALGGMVLIDDDPDYLSVAPDLTFRSRTRYQDEETGEWVSETEVIESPSELVELYNPAELYAAFAEAARQEAGLPAQPTGAEDLLTTAGISGAEGGDDDAWAGAADAWAEGDAQGELPDDPVELAGRLYDLALTWQERSQQSEARLVEQFADAAEPLARKLGDQLILDDEDQRLWFRASGSFEAEVVPEPDEDEDAVPGWMALKSPEELVRFYDPTDLFGDLAETIAERWPEVAPELDEE
ncbi:MAG: hypothetical protein ACKOTZ_00090 [Chloroflexota bacterium]